MVEIPFRGDRRVVAQPGKISACLQVILVSRNLERIADLATNIGEDVVYMVRGITIRHGRTPEASEQAGPGRPEEREEPAGA